MTSPWVAERTLAFDSRGIRKVFDLAAQMTNPIDLSIGQPDFDVPESVRTIPLSRFSLQTIVENDLRLMKAKFLRECAS